MVVCVSRWVVFALFGMLASSAPANAFGEKVSAELKDKSGASAGSAELVAGSGGVLVRLKLKGLAPGGHAVRITDIGKCEGDFASAGDIYNPLGAKFGLLNEDGPMAGEMPNIFVSGSGEAEFELLNHFVSLSPDTDEKLLDDDGAAIVIFDKPSDHVSESDGNAGPRIACGVLSPVK